MPEPADEKPVYQRTDIVERMESSGEFHGLVSEVEKKLGKKAELIHLKQIGPDGENTPLADGLIDMKKMIESSRHAKYFIIEQETFLPDLEKVWAIQQSNIDHLNNLGL